MKKVILIFTLVCGLSCLGQSGNYTINDPVFRINRTASLNITTTWQTIDFNGTSTANSNDFGTDPATGNKMVYWDATNKLIRFIGRPPYKKTFSFSIYPETNTNVITTRATLQIRYVIPNGAGTGVDLIFPFVDTASPYADLGEATILAGGVRHMPLSLPIPVGNAIATNGVRVEIRLSNALGLIPIVGTLGTCTLTNCAIQIQ